VTIDDPTYRAMPNDRHPGGPARPPERYVERQILDLLESHGAREGQALSSYQRIAERSESGPGVQYLVKLILEDEERHHRVFGEMANSINSFVWELDVEPKVPPLVARSDAELLAETRRLLAFEKQDAKELRHLRKAIKHSPKSSLHPLLVELMLHDTAKHIAILEHIRHRLSAA
jgi:rubrerythrin